VISGGLDEVWLDSRPAAHPLPTVAAAPALEAAA